ncbi:MAG: 2-C-methyl-D-erythritol 4-phosphate cytidylyltransferase [Gammaproteobacteria bacterium]
MIWAVVPAAGRGLRMGTGIPKQYLQLAGRPILRHTLDRLLAHPGIARIVVALAEGDPHWPALGLADHPRILTVAGGGERHESVHAALRRALDLGAPGDWALVHDAARPCVSAADIDALIRAATAHPVGALLAAPVRDTMKRAGEDGEVAQTVERAGLWHALTPQMFRLGELIDALDAVRRDGTAVTDESQAMERAGRRPLLVAGSPWNIKVTEPRDRQLAELLLGLEQAG